MMDDERWKLEVSEFIGTIKNEIENNRLSHEKVSTCLRDVESALSELPCGEHSLALAALKVKFSRPYLIGILVIALIPVMFLFLKVRDFQIDFTKEALAIQKTQISLEKFIKTNGYLIKQGNDSLEIKQKGGKRGEE